MTLVRFRPAPPSLGPSGAPPLLAKLVLFLFVLLWLAPAVWAHSTTGVAGGLVSGFTHPLFGLDHVLAMVAVGIWGAQLGAPAIWVLPVTFPLVMALGGALGVLGVPLPAVEIGIAGSALILGLMVALQARPPLWLAAVLVGVFAVFHGHAHGTELPGAANPLAYGLGFVVSTGMLHGCGIVLGLLHGRPKGELLLRTAGVAIAVTGATLLARLVL